MSAILQVSYVTQGPKVAQLALHFGCNDFGSLMMEENVVSATGIDFHYAEVRDSTTDRGGGVHSDSPLSGLQSG